MPAARDPLDPIAALRPTLLRLLRVVADSPVEFRATIDEVAGHDDVAAWERLSQAANQHGVLGVLDGALTVVDLPPRIAAITRRRHAVAELWQAHLLRELYAAVRVLHAAAIPVAPLKGPTLAARLYPPRATRHSIDLDLLVREHDLDRAMEALTANGYVAETGQTAAYLRRHGHHVHLSRAGAPPLELHFRACAGFGVVLPSGLLMDRAMPFEDPAARGAVLVPEPEDEFVYLATHAAGHSFIRLMWLYDLKLLVRAHSGMNWDVVASRSAGHGVSAAVACTLHLLREWLGCAVDGLPRALTRRHVGSRLADRLLVEVSMPQAESMRNNLGGLLFTGLLCDTFAAGAGLVAHHVLRSTRRRLQRLAPACLPERWAG